MNRLIIVGSPREDGRSAALAEQLFEACIEEHPDEEVTLAPVSTLYIEPCTGCNACREPVRQTEEKGEEYRSLCRTIDDEMIEVYELIDAADELIVVSPVYFAGPPAQLKALFDRFQPYFWARKKEGSKGSKLPATLHIVGEGGDPYGYDPLVGIVSSALAVAGFKLERILDWVGKIDEQGEIQADASIILDNAEKSPDTFQNRKTQQQSKQRSSQQSSKPKQRPELRLGGTPAQTNIHQSQSSKRAGNSKGRRKHG